MKNHSHGRPNMPTGAAWLDAVANVTDEERLVARKLRCRPGALALVAQLGDGPVRFTALGELLAPDGTIIDLEGVKR